MHPSDWPALDGIPEDALQFFVIFDHPLDFPRHWVVRRQIAWPGAPNGVVHDVVPRLANSLAEARTFVPHGLYRQPRQEGEDLAIAECWF